ncbi:MAG: NTP transferase domain-containing protein [Planctomycetota bacterium]
MAHYVLAGGRSRRFGSDKARHAIDGVPMVVRVAEAFAGRASRTVVVAQREGAYADLGLKTIADGVADRGPVAGLAAALGHALAAPAGGGSAGWLLLTNADLRWPRASVLDRLVAAAGSTSVAAVYGDGKRYLPFPGLYRVAAGSRADAERVLEGPRSSMQALLRGWGERVAVAAVDGDDRGLRDLDTPAG